MAWTERKRHRQTKQHANAQGQPSLLTGQNDDHLELLLQQWDEAKGGVRRFRFLQRRFLLMQRCKGQARPCVGANTSKGAHCR